MMTPDPRRLLPDAVRGLLNVADMHLTDANQATSVLERCTDDDGRDLLRRMIAADLDRARAAIIKAGEALS